ncbi:MAG: substrate-binding domain-containing protein [Verrucomicrobia bacterium]|nr:substrate-binding domain-containing protein [Verrucomicrobiota bacterium]MCH8510166.1 substrate-binding domain-containing protein [Kiritimatiellia bacterium]
MKKNIAVYLHGETVVEAAMLAGIQRFANLQTDWTIFLYRVAPQLLPLDLGTPSIQGALLPSFMSREISLLRKKKIPLVSFGHDAVHGVSSVVLDNETTGRMAARHLIEEGYTNLIYFANGGQRHSPTRAHGFVTEAERLGHKAKVFEEGPRQRQARKWSLPLQLQDFADLLRATHPPLGIYTCDDVHGERALEACRLAGLRVPDDVGICCFTNNDLFCSLCSPPLSTVTFDMEALGETSVQILAEMLDKTDPPAREVIVLPPNPVQTRRSTQFRMVRAPAVSQFLTYLESHFAEPMDFNAAAKAAGLSRSSLERQVREVTGLTPGQCLKRVRVRECKRLLQETDWDLETIAAETGFSDKSVLSRAIKANTGQSPGKFRRS